MMTSDPSRQIEKGGQNIERVQADERLSCQSEPVGPRRPVEHPRRDLEPALRLRSVQRAAENKALGLLDRRVRADLTAKPW